MRRKIRISKFMIIFFIPVFLFALSAEAYEDGAKNNNTPVQAQSDIRIFLNKEEFFSDVPFFIEEGRTLVPARFLLEKMEAKVCWCFSTKTVSVILGDINIEMVVGEKTALFNGRPVPLDVPVRLIEDRTYIPLRFIAENLGALVDWNGAERLITVEIPWLDSVPPEKPPHDYHDLGLEVETYGVLLGDSTQKVLDLLGEPDRRDETVYGYCWWVYNGDFMNYKQIGIKDGFVVSIFTSGQEWSFGPLHRGCGLDLLDENFDPVDGLFVEEDKIVYELYLPTLVYENLVATFYCDELDGNKILALRLEDRKVTEDRFETFLKYRSPQGERNSWDPAEMREAEAADERQIFDLTNMERMLRGLPLLHWNDAVALVALEHSREMFKYNYFNHFSPISGETLDHRLDNHDVSFTLAAENIACGQLDGIEVHYGLMNSSRHRENILHKDLRSLGVGVYGDRYTQNFITELDEHDHNRGSQEL